MKKIVCLLCSLLLIFSMVACGSEEREIYVDPASSVEKEIDENPTSAGDKETAKLIKGTLNYYPPFENVPIAETYYYSDDYFAKSAKEDDEHLLTCSCLMSIAISEGDNCTEALRVLSEMGYGGFAVEDIEEITRDSIGTVIAHKKTGDNNVIAVLLRGDKYRKEWASNFIVGSEGDAKGFSEARDKVASRLKKYIEENKLVNNKIWICGYSRAGAVANLLGVTLNKTCAEYSATFDDLYIFAFEPPAACAEDTVYDNIRIVANLSDLIVYVYPPSWGLHVNGKVISIGEEKTVMSYKGLLSPAEYKETTSIVLFKEFFDWLSGRLTREVYTEKLDQPLSDVIEIFLGKTDEERTELFGVIGGVLGDIQNDLLLKMQFMALAMRVLTRRSDYLCDQVTDFVVKVLDDKYKGGLDAVLSEEEFSTIKTNLYPIMRTLLPIVVDDMYYHEGIDYDEYYTNNMPNYLLSDYDYGYKTGAIAGESYGYSDGFKKNDYSDQPKDMEELGEEYAKAYADSYKKAYKEAYALGTAHSEDLEARGTYDGGRLGKDMGFADGQNRDNFNDKDRTFYREDWMTDEYVAKYDAAFAEAYAEGYEEGEKAEPKESSSVDILDGYHILSLAKNVGELIKNHYMQNILTYVKALDSYYAE